MSARNARRAAVAAGAILCAAVLRAGPTPLETPALKTPEATERLLLGLDARGGRVIAVGEQGHVVVSDDAGATWTHASVPVSLMLTDVAWSDDATVWATAHDGVLIVSDDRGERWRVALDGTAIATMQADLERIESIEAELDAMADDDPALEDTQFALEDAQFDLEDAESLADGGITSPLLGVRFIDAEHGYAFGAYGVLLETRDGGERWALVSDRLENPDNKHLYSLAVDDAGVLVLVGEAGSVFRSDDGGRQWAAVDIGYGGSLFGVLTTGAGRFRAFGLRGRLFLSDDAGTSWRESDGPARATLTGGRTLADGRVALVGAAGALLVGRPGESALRRVPTPFSGALSDVVAVGPDALLVAGFGGVARVELDAATAGD